MTQTHTHTIFSPAWCLYSIFTILSKTAFLFFTIVVLFSFSIKSTFCHIVECGFDIHWYWCFRFGKPSFHHYSNGKPVPVQCVWMFEITSHFHSTYPVVLSIYLSMYYVILLYRCWTVFRYYFIVSKCVVLNRYTYIYYIFMCPSLTYNIKVWPYLTHMTPADSRLTYSIVSLSMWHKWAISHISPKEEERERKRKYEYDSSNPYNDTPLINIDRVSVQIESNQKICYEKSSLHEFIYIVCSQINRYDICCFQRQQQQNGTNKKWNIRRKKHTHKS